ncbi:hypothetical protein [Streptomyces sp. 11-1-2]|uniref:hypothetical protein n=1 Tax=unclassified Streptomyces TaxID=2593676 RepID=UPI00196994BE|nr:hypothetical protein [Streptomyces sp. 11-1-2]
MLVGAALADGRPAVLLYDAPGLEDWTYRRPFFTGASDQPGGDTGLLTAEGWECPQ